MFIFPCILQHLLCVLLILEKEKHICHEEYGGNTCSVYNLVAPFPRFETWSEVDYQFRGWNYAGEFVYLLQVRRVGLVAVRVGSNRLRHNYAARDYCEISGIIAVLPRCQDSLHGRRCQYRTQFVGTHNVVMLPFDSRDGSLLWQENRIDFTGSCLGCNLMAISAYEIEGGDL